MEPGIEGSVGSSAFEQKESDWVLYLSEVAPRHRRKGKGWESEEEEESTVSRRTGMLNKTHACYYGINHTWTTIGRNQENHQVQYVSRLSQERWVVPPHVRWCRAQNSSGSSSEMFLKRYEHAEVVLLGRHAVAGTHSSLRW